MIERLNEWMNDIFMEYEYDMNMNMNMIDIVRKSVVLFSNPSAIHPSSQPAGQIRSGQSWSCIHLVLPIDLTDIIVMSKLDVPYDKWRELVL